MGMMKNLMKTLIYEYARLQNTQIYDILIGTYNKI